MTLKKQLKNHAWGDTNEKKYRKYILKNIGCNALIVG